jgi:large subunit ribosomal protein L29
MTKSKEYIELSIEKLKIELESLLKEIFNLKMQKATGQVVKTHLIKQSRRNAACIKTILHAQGARI